MEKKQIGISVYPEKSTLKENIDYLKLAKKYGYTQLFISFIHIYKQEDIKKNIDVIVEAKKLGYYISADFHIPSLELVGDSPTSLENIAAMNIDCIRFDSPCLAQDLANLTHNKWEKDIQINMSNNDNFINNVLDFKPILTRLRGGHNFYPQKLTALTYNFFREANQKFVSKNLNTTAFVASHSGKQGPSKKQLELPTLELSRYMSISTQAKILFWSNEINNVLIGNAFATEEELKELSEVNKDEFIFDINVENGLSEIELEILLWQDHFRRGDISSYFIRSTMPRVIWKNTNIDSNNFKPIYRKGDVVIVNNNGDSYKGELHIILEEKYIDEEQKYNFIGTIIDDEKILIDLIEPWSHFRFKIK